MARVIACANGLGVAQLRECSEASLCWLILLTVCVETVGSRLCSTYISFVSSQYVSDPINSIVFSCALLACETDPVTCIPQRRIHGHSTHLTPFTQRICFFPAPTRVMCTLVAFLTKPLVCVCVQTVRSQDFTPTFRYCSCNCMCWVAWRCSATPKTND